MILLAISIGMAFVCGLGWVVTRRRSVLGHGLETSVQVPGHEIGDPEPKALGPKSYEEVEREVVNAWNAQVSVLQYQAEMKLVANKYHGLKSLDAVKAAAKNAGIPVPQFEKDLKKAFEERGK